MWSDWQNYGVYGIVFFLGRRWLSELCREALYLQGNEGEEEDNEINKERKGKEVKFEWKEKKW